MRVATFNLKHGAQPHGYRGDPVKTAEACAALRADVLALQEVDRGVPRSGGADLARLAAEATGMELVFAQTMPFRGGQYGNALLVRGDVDDVEIVLLRPGWRFWVKTEPRNAIVATAVVDGRRLSVAATHLSTQRSASKDQLAQVVDAVRRRPEPQVVVGDLNRMPGELNGHPAATQMMFADGPPTFPAIKPVLRIDHVAVGGAEIRTVEVRRMAVSDHLALIAEIDWPTQ